MARPKYTKPDSNQNDIVQELRALGFDVDIICNLPGLYDLVACKYGKCVRVEVKQPGEKLNDNEVAYWDKQRDIGSLLKAYTAQDVIDWFIDPS